MSEIYTRKCEICGKEFTTNTSRGKLCSEECRKIAKKQYAVNFNEKNKAATRERLGTRICVYCGKEFEPRNNRMVTCNPICTRERYNLLRREMRKEDKEAKKTKKPPKVEPAWKVNEKARKLGMTYGKYQLMKQLEAQRKERKNGR